MSADAIRLLSEAMKGRLEDALGGEAKVYIGPPHDDDSKGNSIGLFLYRIGVNGDLRNTHHVVPAPNPSDPPIETDRALPLDLYFLLTAGDQQTGGEPTALSTLGAAIQTLNDWANFSGLKLLGETTRLTLDPVSSDEMSRIWTLFPEANYRTSVVYVASPVWIYPRNIRPTVKAVTHEQYKVGHGAPRNLG